jgi:hypothetical protein
MVRHTAYRWLGLLALLLLPWNCLGSYFSTLWECYGGAYTVSSDQSTIQLHMENILNDETDTASYDTRLELWALTSAYTETADPGPLCATAEVGPVTWGYPIQNFNATVPLTLPDATQSGTWYPTIFLFEYNPSASKYEWVWYGSFNPITLAGGQRWNDEELVGSMSWQPSGTNVNLQVSQITNACNWGKSGALRLALYATASPYSAPPATPSSLVFADYDFPALYGQQARTGINLNLPYTAPPAGTYYVTLGLLDNGVLVDYYNLPNKLTSGGTTYTITVSASPTAGGSVGGAGTYAAGASRTVTANPNSGYAFVNWTENGSAVSTSSSYTFTLNANRNLVANFTQQPQTGGLKVTIAPSSAVSAGAKWQVDGGTWQASGATVSGLAVGSYTVAFMSISGWIAPTNNTVSVTANNTTQVTATYVQESQSDYYIVLTASPSDGGSVSGAGAFAAGSSRSVRATPGNGYVFENWTESGSVVSTSAVYNFILTTNRDLVANFFSSPFPAVAGTYHGLFACHTNSPSALNVSMGGFTMSVTDKGACSGSLEVGGGRRSFSGQFDASGYLTAQVTPPKPIESVELQLDLSGSSYMVTGSAINPAWTAGVTGARSVFDAKANPAPTAGKYTMAIPGNGQGPMGYGCGTVTISASGTAQFSGCLADGTKISQAGTVLIPSAAAANPSYWPFYVSLNKGQGLIAGWLILSNAPAPALSGNLFWTEPGTKYLPSGFNIQSQVDGSPYSPPASGGSVLNDSGLYVALAGGGLATNVASYLFLGPNSRVTSTNKTSLTFTSSTGAFKGCIPSLASPTGKSIPFAGVVLQNANCGYGWFLGPTQYGAVFMNP